MVQVWPPHRGSSKPLFRTPSVMLYICKKLNSQCFNERLLKSTCGKYFDHMMQKKPLAVAMVWSDVGRAHSIS